MYLGRINRYSNVDFLEDFTSAICLLFVETFIGGLFFRSS